MHDFLRSLGWDDTLETARREHDPALIPGRVAREARGFWWVQSPGGELLCRTKGVLIRDAAGQDDYPVVGDWVLVAPSPGDDTGTIHVLLPRRTRLARKAADTTTGLQVIAANIDIACILTGLDGNFSLRRLERFLLMVREGGVKPLILLNKTDLHADPLAAQGEAAAIAGDAPVLLLSALNREGLETLDPYLKPGVTLCLLGSSGVGKSTLLNALSGDALQKVTEVRAGDSKGRHTTTVRQLFRLPGGALLIDTPGMRELQVWESGDVEETFPDIEALATECRFSDCTHAHEPGCAVLAALESGEIDPGRVLGYQKLQEERLLLDKNRKRELTYKRRMEEKEIAKRRNELNRPKKKR